MIAQFASAYFDGLKQCYAELSVEKVNQVVDLLLAAQQSGRKVLILGNGGSASTATHMACDLAKTATVRGQRSIRAISLTDNVAIMTAWANDASYDCIFQEQVANLLDPGDVVIGISASGNSPSVLRAIEYANQHGAKTVGLIGFGGGKLKDLVHIDITISSRDYGQVENFHLILNHLLAQYVRKQLTNRAHSFTAVASASAE